MLFFIARIFFFRSSLSYLCGIFGICFCFFFLLLLFSLENDCICGLYAALFLNVNIFVVFLGDVCAQCTFIYFILYAHNSSRTFFSFSASDGIGSCNTYVRSHVHIIVLYLCIIISLLPHKYMCDSRRTRLCVCQRTQCASARARSPHCVMRCVFAFSSRGNAVPED